MKKYRDLGCSQEDHIQNCSHFGYSGAYLSEHTPECEKETGGGRKAPCICNPEARKKSKPQEYYILTKAHEALWPRGVILFWAANEEGYSTTLEHAGRYSEEEAKRISKARDSGIGQEDFAVPCEVVEAQAVRVVDIDKFYDLTERKR